MPTTVLDIDFAQPPSEISGLDRYNQALVLIRLCGQPVGRLWLPVVDGRIGGPQLRQALIETAEWPFWERWLHIYLGWEKANPTNSSPPTATVAVCTRDRPKDLRRCLEGLMALPDDGQEFLVIDNCPLTEATQNLVAEYRRVRYVREDRPGLNRARNRALREARHEIIAFIDDDAVPDPGWLRALLRNYDDPLALCVTGLIMPLELETEAQEWFEHYISFARGFRHRVFEEAFKKPLYAGRCGAGTNMSFRRSVLECVGPFDEALDTGTPTYSSGDNEMFSRILGAGYHIIYDPAALSWHRHRRTFQELRRQLYGYGVGNVAAWTRSLLVEGELDALQVIWRAIRRRLKELRRNPGSVPIGLVLVILLGYAIGPWAYLYSGWRLRNEN